MRRGGPASRALGVAAAMAAAGCLIDLTETFPQTNPHAPPATCLNGELDPDETDLDCGGDCPGCGYGGACTEDRDCLAADCLSDLTCACPSCPDGTSPIPGVCACVDNYELSVRDDAGCAGGTAFGVDDDDYPAGFPRLVASAGLSGEVDVGGTTYDLEVPTVALYACSLQGVEPAGYLSLFQALRLCENSGKRLCTPEAWRAACRGDDDTDYPYGDAHVPDTCNDLDDTTGTPDPQVCGGFGDCHGSGATATVFDMSGNLAEWVTPCVGTLCTVRGGWYGDWGYESTCDNDTRSAMPGSGATYRWLGARCCLNL